MVDRLFLLRRTGSAVLGMSPLELITKGLADPVRLFVKNEPHPTRKLVQERYRLISSISLVDQLVERMLFGPQNELEIRTWASIPSKPGMGLSKWDQAGQIWTDLCVKHRGHPAAEADISGFDWSVQDWELWADLAMRQKLGGFEIPHCAASTARFYCFMNAVFQLSNGTLIQQELPGLMKSGSYCTSSTNSRIRCLMAELIGSPWCIAMGDDSVEGYVQDAKELYSVLGHECKDYTPCATTTSGALREVNFCSHLLAEKKFYLTTWPKTLFRFLSSKHESCEDLEVELNRNPIWPRVKKYLVRIGRACDKDGQEENGKKKKTAGHQPEEGSGDNYSSGKPPAEETAAAKAARWLRELECQIPGHPVEYGGYGQEIHPAH